MVKHFQRVYVTWYIAVVLGAKQLLNPHSIESLIPRKADCFELHMYTA